MAHSPEQSREWRANGVQRLRDYLGSVCAICDSKDDLHIDHIDPATKSFNPSRYHYWPWEKLLDELQKCQLLCLKHHLEKSKIDGSKARGSRVAGAKLTPEKVRQIRERAASGVDNATLAEEYDISRSNVDLVIKRKSWRHVE